MLKFILTLALMPLAIGCAQTKNTSTPLNEYKVKIGESLVIENSTIIFSDVTEDSRCPLNTQCIWNGRAIIQFNIDGQSKAIYFGETRPGEPTSLEVISGFEVSSLLPIPDGNNNINKAAYQVTLKKKI